MYKLTVRANQNPESIGSQVAATRMLLKCGLVAGPLYLLIFAMQIFLRPEFHFTREPSLLSIGPLGWIQIGNEILGGLLVIAGAQGMRRVVRRSKSDFWGPLLLQVFGFCQIGVGIFVVDPVRPPAIMTVHGTLHIVLGGIGFVALMAACFVFVRAFLLWKRKGWAIYCAIVGLMFLAAFLSAARIDRQHRSSIQVFLNLIFILEWIWLSSISAQYSQQRLSDPFKRDTLVQTGAS